VVGPLGPETEARPVVEPQTATFRLLQGHFEPFPAPDVIGALDAYPPAFVEEQLTDAAVAVAATLLGEPNDRFGERGLVPTNLGLAALRSSSANRRAGGFAIPTRCAARASPEPVYQLTFALDQSLGTGHFWPAL
jgi:hypothetical protein